MNHIKLLGDKLIINFEFDVALVTKIRTIDGRFWNSKLKRWEVPVENTIETLKILKPFNFTVSPEVDKYLLREEAELKRIDELKNCEDQPYTGNLPLHNYQRKGAMFLKQMPNALLGDVPGLGKSIQTIAALENDPGPHLIVCPNSLKYNWKEEILKWEPKSKVLVIDGDKQRRSEQWILYAKKHKYVIVNYELLRIDIAEILKV